MSTSDVHAGFARDVVRRLDQDRGWAVAGDAADTGIVCIGGSWLVKDFEGWAPEEVARRITDDLFRRYQDLAVDALPRMIPLLKPGTLPMRSHVLGHDVLTWPWLADLHIELAICESPATHDPSTALTEQHAARWGIAPDELLAHAIQNIRGFMFPFTGDRNMTRVGYDRRCDASWLLQGEAWQQLHLGSGPRRREQFLLLLPTRKKPVVLLANRVHHESEWRGLFPAQSEQVLSRHVFGITQDGVFDIGKIAA